MKTLFWLVVFSFAAAALAACTSPTPSVTSVITVVATRRPRPAETRAAEAVPTIAAVMSTVVPTLSPGSTVTAVPAVAGTGAQVPGSCNAIAPIVGAYIGGVGTTKSLGVPQHLSCEFMNTSATTLAVVNIGAGGTAAAFDALRTTSAQGGRTVTPISGLGASAFSVSKNNVPAGVSVITDQGLVYAVITNLPIAQDEALIKQLMSLP
ncbi:MAG TPA: hypothetical protein VMP08_11780 [Anaerolineae bacterium]|nr:hypothetical protein [Anaerolineae bacterium]